MIKSVNRKFKIFEQFLAGKKSPYNDEVTPYDSVIISKRARQKVSEGLKTDIKDSDTEDSNSPVDKFGDPKTESIENILNLRKKKDEFIPRFQPKTSYPDSPEKLKKAEDRVERIISNKLPNLAPNQQKAIEIIRATGVSDIDLFHGSHIVVEDKGKLYNKLCRMGVRPTISSHYPDANCQQYKISLKQLGVILFGKDTGQNTWFQMEAHDSYGFEAYLHIRDYILHMALGYMNVGCFGMSPHTEKKGNEIRIKEKEA